MVYLDLEAILGGVSAAAPCSTASETTNAVAMTTVAVRLLLVDVGDDDDGHRQRGHLHHVRQRRIRGAAPYVDRARKTPGKASLCFPPAADRAAPLAQDDCRLTMRRRLRKTRRRGAKQSDNYSS